MVIQLMIRKRSVSVDDYQYPPVCYALLRSDTWMEFISAYGYAFSASSSFSCDWDQNYFDRHHRDAWS